MLLRKKPLARLLDGLTLESRIDAGGFDQLMLTDEKRQQITVTSLAADIYYVENTQAECWLEEMAGLDKLACAWLCDSTTPDVPVLVGGMFKPTDPEEQKDLSELATWLTVDGPVLYNAAAGYGIEAIPGDEAQLAARISAVFDVATPLESLEEMKALDWEDHARYTTVGNKAFSVLVINTSVPGVSEELDQLMNEWDLPVQVTRTRFIRPFASPTVADELGLDVAGRNWALVTVEGGAGSDEVLYNALNPKVRLHCRRGWCRQKLLLTASLGIGVLGYQHANSIDRKVLP